MTRRKKHPEDKGRASLSQDRSVDPIIGEPLGERLSTLFDELSGEPVPDHLIDLANRLKKDEALPKDERNTRADS